MRNAIRMTSMAVAGVVLLGAAGVRADDWPQWRGPNRDNIVKGFNEPKTWPKTLTQKWKVTVGVGESSPLLVGDKLFVFARQGGDEVILCLDAVSGKEIWKDDYTAPPVKGAASPHPGTRATPVVAEGKICTFGASGIVSCVDIATGKMVWRKDTKSFPQFYTSSSPI